ncbi:hypothetical protein [Geomicrobium sediminis]|uniref:Uncharacterized protein n=1 Tax=Geomicrobium sediminis TaxID=1347788 RepID=A0ABS2PHL9_9BACL|nr:hypothetical protein [Geomicrobium sediminis]MBM7634943.1 hypothetical protein [Geomicrobium sediminis]
MVNGCVVKYDIQIMPSGCIANAVIMDAETGEIIHRISRDWDSFPISFAKKYIIDEASLIAQEHGYEVQKAVQK